MPFSFFDSAVCVFERRILHASGGVGLTREQPAASSNQMRRALSQSYIMHGLVGGVLAVPVMFLTFYASFPMGFVADETLKLGIFWAAFVLVPAATAAVLYLVRQHMAKEKSALLGFVLYALPGTTSGFLTLGLTLLIAPTGLFGASTIAVAAITAGVCVGVACLFLERRAQAFTRQSMTNRQT